MSGKKTTPASSPKIATRERSPENDHPLFRRWIQAKPADQAQAILDDGGAPTYDGKPVPLGGCAGKAEAELAGQLGSGFPMITPPHSGGRQVTLQGQLVYLTLTGWLQPKNGVLDELLWAAVDQMRADPRVIAAKARWRQCMLTAGFDYPGPVQAQFDRRWGPPPGTSATPSANWSLQVEVATADARCEAKVGWSGLRQALLAKYESQLVNSHVTELAALKHAQARLIANANAVLEGRQPS